MTPAEYDRYSTPLYDQPGPCLQSARHDCAYVNETARRVGRWAARAGLDLSEDVDAIGEIVERMRLKVEARRAEVERG